MASGIDIYPIGYSRLARSQMDGFALQPDGSLVTDADRMSQHVFLGCIDSAREDCAWGRLSFDLEIAKETVLTVHAFATNETSFLRDGIPQSLQSFLLSHTEKVEAKAALFDAAEATRQVNTKDILLYQQKGRYLWLWLEGAGYGQVKLQNLRVSTPGDRFTDSFPSIYQKEGDFFHRYLSIFFTLYSDLQLTIDNFAQLVDLDTAPAELLPVFAQWLGLELDGNFMDEACLRRYLRLAPELSAAKGTRQAIRLAVGLFVDCPVYLVERNLLDRHQLAKGDQLYGDSPYDFTLLVGCQSSELLRARLTFIVNRYKPIRSRLNLVFLGDQSGVDAYTYLDTNASLQLIGNGSLGVAGAQAGSVYLE